MYDKLRTRGEVLVSLYKIITMHTNEIWSPVKGYESLYEVSNFGRVRGIKRGVILKQKEKIYYKVTLSKNCVTKLYTVHRLVAKAFIPNPLNKPQINHIDGNKLNNHVDNLEWCTAKENIQHAVKSGLTRYCTTKIFMFDFHGTLLKEYSSISDCAKKEGLRARSIQNAAKRNTALQNFRFSFTDKLIMPEHNVNRKVALINTEGNVISVYKSAQEAARKLGLNRGDHIAKICRGFYKTYKGNRFKYV